MPFTSHRVFSCYTAFTAGKRTEEKMGREKDIKIRIARTEDAEALLRIYAPYVEKTAITFEYEAPALSEFRERIENTLKKISLSCSRKGRGNFGVCLYGVFWRTGGL